MTVAGFAPLLVLAHAGAGATWQALVVVAAAGFSVVFIGAVAGRVQLSSGDDLILPVAAVAIVSSIAPAFSESLSDAVTWAMPAGAVVLVAILLAAFTRLHLTRRSALTWGTVGLAAVLAVALRPTLTNSLHPADADLLPQGDDVELEVVDPADGAVAAGGALEVTYRLTGGTLLPAEHDDPTEHGPAEHGRLRLLVDGLPVEGEVLDTCTVAEPCREVTYALNLERGERRIVAEFVTQDELPFTPPVSAILEVVAE